MHNKFRSSSRAVLALTLAFAATAATTTAAQAQTATARFVDAQGKPVGTATLSANANGSGVLIDINLTGLPPGEHGFHVHQKGVCDGADGFKSAGEHHAPRKHEHGYRSSKGVHAGDMPNQFVGADGTLRAHVLNTGVSLRRGTGTLFDGDGSALVLHAKPDDYRSQPAGDSGDRIACAVVERAP